MDRRLIDCYLSASPKSFLGSQLSVGSGGHRIGWGEGNTKNNRKKAVGRKSGEPCLPEPQITHRARTKEYTMYKSEGRWVVWSGPVKGRETPGLVLLGYFSAPELAPNLRSVFLFFNKLSLFPLLYCVSLVWFRILGCKNLKTSVYLPNSDPCL